MWVLGSLAVAELLLGRSGVCAPLVCLGVLYLSVLRGWRLALVVSLIIPIFMVVVMYRRRQMSAASRAAKQKTGVINAEIESGLSGVRTTKAFANEEKRKQSGSGRPTRCSRPPSDPFTRPWVGFPALWNCCCAA